MRKRILTFIICLMICFSFMPRIHAEGNTLSADGKYHVVNVDKKGNYKIVKTFDTYAEAKVSHTLLHTTYNNLGITLGDSFLTIDQGVVAFQNTDCTVNTNYTMDNSEEAGYLNGCYGNDAAFLEYNTASNQVKFKVSGVVGWVSGDDVSIYPIESLPSVSSFIVKEKILYHQIKSSAQSGAFANTISLSKAPSYLKQDTTYYSYDSHYFYTSYTDMIRDYRSGNNKNALNAKDPYYNYYQYMDHRSTSSYTPKQLNTYFKDALAFNHTITDFYDKDNYVHDILTQSLLFQGSDAFFQYQNQFGANALMMLSLSLNESAMGRSYIAYTKNNLFGHAAFDSSAEESASRYQSVASSIYSHALHYISNSYLNPEEFQYSGGYFGNKAGGMNVAYASDPYWGEKAAHYYYSIDEAMGSKDYNQYALGISDQTSVNVYPSASTKKDPLYTINKNYNGSFILLEKITNKDGTWYRVQSDVGLNKSKEKTTDGTYAFKYSNGYINANDLKTIRNAKQIDSKSYVTITFEAAGGTFYPESEQIQMQVETGMIPVITAPVKDNALFNGWDIKLESAKENLTYKATYKPVKSMELIEKPTTSYHVGDTLNLKNGKIRVNFKDGTNKEFDLTSDMVSGFSSETEGDQRLTITHAGTTTFYDIKVSKSLDEEKKELNDRAAYMIKTYSGKTGLTQEAIDEITSFRNDLTKMKDSVLTRDQIRVIDRIIQENLSPRYSVIINDDTYDLQSSGLGLALQGERGFLQRFMPKTIKINVDDTLSKDDETLVKKVATANDMHIAGMLTIDGTDDVSSLKLKSDMVFSIKKPKGDSKYRYYRVYYIDGDDVYQLPSSQSESRILFTNDTLGSYAIVYQNRDNVTQESDFIEVNTKQQNGKNYIMNYIILPIALLCIFALLCIVYICYRRKKHKHIKNKNQTNIKTQE